MNKITKALSNIVKKVFDKEKKHSKIKIDNIEIHQAEQYGTVHFKILTEQMFENGLLLGDSVNIEFDNGTYYEDIAYYNGFYAKSSEMILLSHPSDKYPALFVISGESAWNRSKVSPNNKATISLNQRGKYKEVQDMMSFDYSNNREDYNSDEEFANFRVLKGGRIKDNLVYRGASPIDNSLNRAKYASNFIEKNNIGYIMNLADNETKYNNFLENGDVSNYIQNLHDTGRMSLLYLGTNFYSDRHKKEIAKAFKNFVKNGEKVYLHCLEGKDRAGFVSALILALSGANSEEITKDYMTTYKNYNGISKEANKERYDAVANLKVPEFFEIFFDDNTIKDYSTVNLQDGAKKYLMSGGMSEEEVEKAIKFLTK